MRSRQSLFHKYCGLCGQLTHVGELIAHRARNHGRDRTVKVCLCCLEQHGGDRGVRALLRSIPSAMPLYKSPGCAQLAPARER